MIDTSSSSVWYPKKSNYSYPIKKSCHHINKEIQVKKPRYDEFRKWGQQFSFTYNAKYKIKECKKCKSKKHKEEFLKWGKVSAFHILKDDIKIPLTDEESEIVKCKNTCNICKQTKSIIQGIE